MKTKELGVILSILAMTSGTPSFAKEDDVNAEKKIKKKLASMAEVVSKDVVHGNSCALRDRKINKN